MPRRSPLHHVNVNENSSVKAHIVKTPVLIREALPGEAPGLTLLAMRSKAYWGYSPEFMEACREELTVCPEDLARGDHYCAVATKGKKIIGFHALGRLPDGNFEREALFVEPEHIGCGNGRMPIEDAINTAAYKGGKELIVQGDPNAATFYRAAGGKRVGERESGSIPGRFLPVYSISLLGLSPRNASTSSEGPTPGDS